MEPKLLFQKLQSNMPVFDRLLSGVSEKERNWRLSSDQWSIHEVACHLLDEERDDFRKRIESIFKDFTKAFEPIDPEGWIRSRSYSSRDYGSTVDSFLEERISSVNWLESLDDADWSLAYEHPRFGPLTTEMILHNWIAHDMLHIRQILKIQYHFLVAESKGIDFRYAGSW